MSMIFMKAFSFAVKAFARPVVTYLTYYNRKNMENSNKFFIKKIRLLLIGFGQKFHLKNQQLNRKIFKLNNDSPINPLSESMALEKGAELIAEFIIYSIIIYNYTL